MLKYLCTAIGVAGHFLSCNNKNNNDYQSYVNDPVLYAKTVKQLNDVVLENNFPPMIATRNYAYANIAAYETMVAGNSQFQSLAGQIKHLPAIPAPETGKTIDFALASLLRSEERRVGKEGRCWGS